MRSYWLISPVSRPKALRTIRDKRSLIYFHCSRYLNYFFCFFFPRRDSSHTGSRERAIGNNTTSRHESFESTFTRASSKDRQTMEILSKNSYSAEHDEEAETSVVSVAKFPSLDGINVWIQFDRSFVRSLLTSRIHLMVLRTKGENHSAVIISKVVDVAWNFP